MPHFHIAVVVGNLRHDSFNQKMATALAKLAPADFTFKQVSIGDLPLYNQDGDIGEASKKFLQGWMDQYTTWIRRHAA